MNYYKNFAKNIYSQNGDDGIIEKLFEDLNIKSGTILDVGASFPIRRSNTFNLWKNKNFNAILIDPDQKCLNELNLLSKNFENVVVLPKLVSTSKSNDTIDNILKDSKFDASKDALSLINIDVDGIDIPLFESIKEHQPKIVVVEIDSGCAMYEKIRPGSLWNLNEIAKSKNYTLVFCNGNAYLVRDDLVKLLPHQYFNYEDIYNTGPAICEAWYQTLDQHGNSREYISCDSFGLGGHVHRIVNGQRMTKFYHLSKELTMIEQQERESCLK